jgi:uncharacterized integral membrane protein
MVQQTKVAASNGASKSASNGLAWDVGAFANDAVTLTELQSQLLAADMRECSRGAWVPSLVLLAGLALGLACFPIAMVTAALGLVYFLETSHFTAFLIVLAGGVIGSALLCVLSWIRVRQHVAVLGRSRDELVRNLRWMKRVITRNRPA